MMLRLVWIISLVVTCVSSEETESCPKQCRCDGHVMSCSCCSKRFDNGTCIASQPYFEKSLPTNITDAKISACFLKSDSFDNEGWESVTNLDLNFDDSMCFPMPFDASLSQLQNLTNLKIGGSVFRYLGVNSLRGLEKLKNLNLVNFYLTSYSDRLLEGNFYFPYSLKRLVIDTPKEGYLFSREFIVSAEFFNLYKRRNIHTIALKRVPILKLTLPNPSFLCSSIRYLSFSYSVIKFMSSDFLYTPSCNPDLTVDLTGIKIGIPNTESRTIVPEGQITMTKLLLYQPDFNILLTDIRTQFNCNVVSFFMNVKYIIAAFVLKNLKRAACFVEHVMFMVYMCSFFVNSLMTNNMAVTLPLKRIDLSDNGIKELKFSNIFLDGFPIDNWFKYIQFNLEEIDLSFNYMTYLSSNMLPYMIQRLLLMDNKLHVMEHHHPSEFQRLFTKFIHLRELDISFNDITHIPYGMFQNNRQLVSLILSYNRLTTVFDISNLPLLLHIDISNNNIIKLNVTERQFVQSNSSVVNLSENHFECSCVDMEFIIWVKESQFWSGEPFTNIYLCDLNGTKLDMKREALNVTMAYCDRLQMLRLKELEEASSRIERLKSRRILMISCMVVSYGLLTVIIACILRIKFYILNKRKKQFVDNIQLERFPLKFLIFLSFCSAEEDLVHNYILPHLSERLRALTKNENNHVCYGDLHFRLGHTIVEETMRCIEMSAVSVFIISQSFAKRPWCRMELTEAVNQQKPIILIMTETLKEEKMTRILRQVFNRYTRFKCTPVAGGRYEVSPGWDELCTDVIELACFQDQEEEANCSEIEENETAL